MLAGYHAKVAEQRANDDVRATMTWLDEAGFQVTEFSGGKDAGFGNLLLVQCRRIGADRA